MTTVTEESEWFSPDAPSENGTRSYVSIADADDYEKFVRKPRTAISREYEGRTKSLLKTVMVGALNMSNYSDAAAIIHYGPDFAIATGDLADSDPRIRKAIDLITSPANPYAMFFTAALPFIVQLLRNHEDGLKEIPVTWRERRKYRKTAETTPGPSATIRLPFGRQLNLRFRFKLRNPLRLITAGARAQSYPPDQLTVKVFSDKKLQRALERQGIHISVNVDDQS